MYLEIITVNFAFLPLRIVVCWCLVWAGEPEAGEWDEQSRGRSQVSSAAGDGSGDEIWTQETTSALTEDGVRVCAFFLQADRGEGGWNFSTTGDLCWESPATSETMAFIFAHHVSLNVFICKKKTTVSSSWQEAEIDGIHQLVVGATENVKEGNEDIREVICCTPAWPFCSYVSLNTVVSSFITRQSKTTPASGCGSYFSWLCARFLSFSWTGMTASRHGLYDKKPGNCRISGTFALRHRHGNDAETDCPVLHVGSGALYEDTEGGPRVFRDANQTLSLS